MVLSASHWDLLYETKKSHEKGLIECIVSKLVHFKLVLHKFDYMFISAARFLIRTVWRFPLLQSLLNTVDSLRLYLVMQFVILCGETLDVSAFSPIQSNCFRRSPFLA